MTDPPACRASSDSHGEYAEALSLGTLLGYSAAEWWRGRHLAPRIARTGWLSRALSSPSPFVEAVTLLGEWPS